MDLVISYNKAFLNPSLNLFRHIQVLLVLALKFCQKKKNLECKGKNQNINDNLQIEISFPKTWITKCENISIYWWCMLHEMSSFQRITPKCHFFFQITWSRIIFHFVNSIQIWKDTERSNVSHRTRVGSTWPSCKCFLLIHQNLSSSSSPPFIHHHMYIVSHLFISKTLSLHLSFC